MFRKLRQNSKQLLQVANSSKRTIDDSLASDLSYLKVGEGRLTFLDLPAEIRNTIYEEVASSTRLYVSAAAAKKKEKESKHPPQSTPALLLTSKQIRLEYSPLLLECSAISFAIREFDFKNLMRVSSSLYSSELKALRKNTRLTIRLLATKPSKETIMSLRRWAQRRTEDMYTFPVHYALVWPKLTQIVPTSASVRRIDTYIQRRTVLIQNMESISGLMKNVPEALQWELQPLLEVFQREMDVLGAMGSSGGGRSTDPYAEPSGATMFGRRA